jgi:tRNA(Ile)-lysidine synthase
MRGDLAAVHGAVRDCLGDVARSAGLVLVACSGGPDSLTLAAVTARTARAHGFAAGAVVVDHGWSAEASAAGEWAAGQCRALGLDPVELVMVNAGGSGGSGGRAGGGGPEAVARKARYAALQDAVDRHGAVGVLLGHTLDDQAETVLLGLGRGSGARSLAGMAAQRGVFRRPFLGLRREVVARAGDALGLHPWHDPANDDPAYTRVRVRRLAGELEKALGAGTAEALARSAAMLRQDADALDALAADLLDRAVTMTVAADPTPASSAALTAFLIMRPFPGTDPPGTLDPAGVVEVRVEPVRGALPALRRRALLLAARRAGCPGGALSHRHALALERLLLTGGGQVALPGSVRAEVVRR